MLACFAGCSAQSERQEAVWTICCSGDHGVEKVMGGQGALDILTAIVRETAPMFDRTCLKERAKGNAEGNCVLDAYESGRSGKQNWLRAYRARRVHYHKYEYCY